MKNALVSTLILAGLPILLPAFAQAQDAEALFKSKSCVACHKIDSKLVGPSYKDVAAKYAGQDGAVEILAGKIKNGVMGDWGPIPMPPNAVTEEQARILAEWVLQQK
ncbi:c-type cytochrome [Azomonas macrocytogenes]|uniref:Cytochrome c-551 n=1 Tax=Azomonas macrocytogenes TaxID=69962 RepID=A0A839SZ01_AZOMA|nr:c-type cytochrome [Azomonas macrocytogenes]MBB3102372.1 cytochrome c [Azomonas macrocytogenes]